MAGRNRIAALAVVACVGIGIGFGATHLWDQRTIHRLASERDAARDCRRSGTSLAPCPVMYRNTRIAWRERITTVRTPDPKQAARVAALSGELRQAHRTIRNLERRRIRRRFAAVRGWQNGTRQFPYATDKRCPAGSVVVYDADLSGTARRGSGDPGVCYVAAMLHRVALATPRH